VNADNLRFFGICNQVGNLHARHERHIWDRFDAPPDNRFKGGAADRARL